MPSTVVGAVAFRNEALNWTPCVRSLIQDPLAWTNSPAEIIAAWPTRVMRSRWPRALTRRTQKPFSELWNVTRSTSPAKTSVGVLVLGACGISGMMEIKILGRYRDQVGTACQAALATGEEASKARGVARVRQNQRCLGTLDRAGATHGAGNYSPTIRDAWGFEAWCVLVNI